MPKAAWRSPGSSEGRQRAAARGNGCELLLLAGLGVSVGGKTGQGWEGRESKGQEQCQC